MAHINPDLSVFDVSTLSFKWDNYGTNFWGTVICDSHPEQVCVIFHSRNENLRHTWESLEWQDSTVNPPPPNTPLLVLTLDNGPFVGYADSTVAFWRRLPAPPTAKNTPNSPISS